MINFKEHLLEARLAPLYHGTSGSAFLSMCEEDVVRPSTIHEMGKLLMGAPKDGSKAYRGVSTTRSFKLASHFINGDTVANAGAVVLEFDQLKLSQNFRIVPIQFWATPRNASRSPTWPTRSSEDLGKSPPKNEYEEFIVTRSGVPMKYVRRVWLSKGHGFDENYKFSNHVNDLMKKYNITFGYY